MIDGATRDAAHVLRMGFPVFCRYRTPMDSGPRWLAVEWGQPVTIGGVRVEPGDVVVGDLDGVVAVPKALAVPVLLECEDLSHAENQVRDAVKTVVRGPRPPTRSSAFSEQRAGKLASPRR